MIICQQNFLHSQELQKQANIKSVKLWSYASGEKVWLNSKYIKIKRIWKLEFKFFGPFWVLQAVGNQAYKLELQRKWRIHDIFLVSLLEQNTTRKGQIEKKFKFKAKNSIWKLTTMLNVREKRFGIV